MIEPVADRLKIPLHRIYANRLLFHNDVEGSFAGFDVNEPTSRDGGKPAVIQQLIDCQSYKPIIMIGDGATDLQAKPPADCFIGYGGIIEREKVKAGADWFIYDFQVIIIIYNN
jgi:phosphoserine phosphatase